MSKAGMDAATQEIRFTFRQSTLTFFISKVLYLPPPPAPYIKYIYMHLVTIAIHNFLNPAGKIYSLDTLVPLIPIGFYGAIF